MSISLNVKSWNVKDGGVVSGRDMIVFNEHQLFESSYHYYYCSFILTQANLIEEGQFLRSYSQGLLEYAQEKGSKKNWNDINFPAALEALAVIGLDEIEGKKIALEVSERPICKSLKEYALDSILITEELIEKACSGAGEPNIDFYCNSRKAYKAND